MAARPAAGARPPRRRPRSEAEAPVRGVFGQWLSVRSVSRRRASVFTLRWPSPTWARRVDCKIGNVTAGVPSNEGCLRGGPVQRNATNPRSLTSFAHIQPHSRPPGGWRSGGQEEWPFGCARHGGVFITGWQPRCVRYTSGPVLSTARSPRPPRRCGCHSSRLRHISQQLQHVSARSRVVRVQP